MNVWLMRSLGVLRVGGRTLTPTPAPRPGPRRRRGRSKARAPTARITCLLAPGGEGLGSCRGLVPAGVRFLRRLGAWGLGRWEGYVSGNGSVSG
ncbi:hypothetical protein BI317_00095 [Xanthomonas hortorum pv. gardneri]|nr:hypothetical protein BI317_00095 [Xanthomonas hortorum pv. gardneri]